LEGFHADGGHMVIAWEHTKVSIPIHVDSNALIMAEIKEKLINAKGEIKAQTSRACCAKMGRLRCRLA
ncbi:MAG: hypothetical protein ACPGSW_02395, partial [Phaeobacter italicus]